MKTIDKIKTAVEKYIKDDQQNCELYNEVYEAIKRIEAAIGRDVTGCEFKELKMDLNYVEFKKHKYSFKDLKDGRTWVVHFIQPFTWHKAVGDIKTYPDDMELRYDGEI